MTANQIAYAKLLQEGKLEQSRQKETARHNWVTEQQSSEQIVETRRANQAREGNTRAELAETKRSNQAREAHNVSSLEETKRSNRASEELKRIAQAETERSNRASETENHRSNVARETENNRSNIAKETEQHRTNTVNEYLKAVQNQETNRSNLVLENLRSWETAAKVADSYGTTDTDTKDVTSEESGYNASAGLNLGVGGGSKSGGKPGFGLTVSGGINGKSGSSNQTSTSITSPAKTATDVYPLISGKAAKTVDMSPNRTNLNRNQAALPADYLQALSVARSASAENLNLKRENLQLKAQQSGKATIDAKMRAKYPNLFNQSK